MNQVKLFVSGGANSGKTAYAIKRALELEGEHFYLATAVSTDSEMEKKITLHKEERGSRFETVEEQIEISGKITELNSKNNILLIDCLGFWVNNIIFSNQHENFKDRIAKLVETVNSFSGSIIFVSNEVGLGLVPSDKISRLYVSLLGELNQAVANSCHSAVFMVSGQPLVLKE